MKELKDGQKVMLDGVIFVDWQNRFFVNHNIAGTFDAEHNRIDFDKCAFDHFYADMSFLGKIQTGEDFGVDYDAVFYFPDEFSLVEAKKLFFVQYTEKIASLEKDIADLKKNQQTMLASIL